MKYSRGATNYFQWHNRPNEDWLYARHQGILLQYHVRLRGCSLDVLKKIAGKVLENAPIRGPGNAVMEIGSHDGISYFAFSIVNPNDELVIVIDTEEHLKNSMGINLQDLMVHKTIKDGQCKHGRK